MAGVPSPGRHERRGHGKSHMRPDGDFSTTPDAQAFFMSVSLLSPLHTALTQQRTPCALAAQCAETAAAAMAEGNNGLAGPLLRW